MPTLALAALLAILALLGHALLWIATVNRIHGTGISRKMAKGFSLLTYVSLVALPAVTLWAGYQSWWQTDNDDLAAWLHVSPILAGYWSICIAAEAVFLPWWLCQKVTYQPLALLRSNHTRIVDVVAQLGYRPVQGWRARLLTRIPGNQALTLQVHDKVLALPRLSAELEGLTIAHLSDLHLTGRIDKPYFREVVRLTNELQADVIAITGDIFDSAHCFAWMGDTLAQLRSRWGIFFVLGNHDPLTGDVLGVRRLLTDAGMIDLGGAWREVPAGEGRLLLAGNELPWLLPPPVIPESIMATSSSAVTNRPLRILLSHSPDQIHWARRHDFDLMLAGHTHGGQIRFPWIGPVLAPSLYGVRFAGGTFWMPPTVMHVSRGVSGKLPLRLNCPPEVTRLTLRRA